jgi:hypothetical protein
LPVVEEIINSVTVEMGDYVFSQMLAERVKIERSAKRDETEVTRDFKKEFDQLWKSVEYRLRRSPAKRVLSGVNRLLTEASLRPIMVHNLATAHRLEEIPPEISGTLRRVEEAAGIRKR